MATSATPSLSKDQDKMTHRCFQCAAKFSTSGELVNHMKHSHTSFVRDASEKIDRSKELSAEINPGRVNTCAICPFCHIDCQTRKRLMTHLEFQHRDEEVDKELEPELKLMRLMKAPTKLQPNSLPHKGSISSYDTEPSKTKLPSSTIAQPSKASYDTEPNKTKLPSSTISQPSKASISSNDPEPIAKLPSSTTSQPSKASYDTALSTKLQSASQQSNASFSSYDPEPIAKLPSTASQQSKACISSYDTELSTKLPSTASQQSKASISSYDPEPVPKLPPIASQLPNSNPQIVQKLLKEVETEERLKASSAASAKFPDKRYKCFWCELLFRKRGKLMDHIDMFHKANKQESEMEAELLYGSTIASSPPSVPAAVTSAATAASVSTIATSTCSNATTTTMLTTSLSNDKQDKSFSATGLRLPVQCSDESATAGKTFEATTAVYSQSTQHKRLQLNQHPFLFSTMETAIRTTLTNDCQDSPNASPDASTKCTSVIPVLDRLDAILKKQASIDDSPGTPTDLSIPRDGRRHHQPPKVTCRFVLAGSLLECVNSLRHRKQSPPVLLDKSVMFYKGARGNPLTGIKVHPTTATTLNDKRKALHRSVTFNPTTTELYDMRQSIANASSLPPKPYSAGVAIDASVNPYFQMIQTSSSHDPRPPNFLSHQADYYHTESNCSNGYFASAQPSAFTAVEVQRPIAQFHYYESSIPQVDIDTPLDLSTGSSLPLHVRRQHSYPS